MWAVVKSYLLVCSREDFCSTRMIASWCCHDWKRKLIYGVPLFPLYYTHTLTGYIKKKKHCCTWPLLHFCLQPFQIIPVVIIRGHEGALLRAEIQKRWMRMYGSTLGCYYYLCQAGYVSVCVIFIVILDHFWWEMNFSVVGMNVFFVFFAKIERILMKCASGLEIMHRNTWIEIVAWSSSYLTSWIHSAIITVNESQSGVFV